MPDPLGNVNNWLFVRKPEGAGQAYATTFHCVSSGLGVTVSLRLHTSTAFLPHVARQIQDTSPRPYFVLPSVWLSY